MSLDKREKDLIEFKNELDLRESILSKGEDRLSIASEEHLLKVSSINDSHIDLVNKHKEADEKLLKAEEDLKRVESQRLDILSLINEQKSNIEKLELLKKQIEDKVNEQDLILKENAKKEKNIVDLTVDNLRSKADLDRSLEVQRNLSSVMKKQKQELEDLKNQIANHEAHKQEEAI